MTYSVILDIVEQTEIDEAFKTAPVLSQIYGYRNKGNGTFEIVENEATVINDVITQLATIDFIKPEKLLSMILSDFLKASPQIRNRSGRRWSVTSLCGLVRPVYAGLALDSWGRLRPVDNYPAIVAPEFYHKASRNLKIAGLLPENVPI